MSSRTDSIRTHHMARLAALGPKPPWWRPLKRTTWVRAAKQIVQDAIAACAAEAWREVWERIAARQWAREQRAMAEMEVN